MKAKEKVVIIIVALIIASPILFLISCPIVNDISAKAVADDIAKIPLPDGTQEAERFSQAGKLVGNGNGMQFFGAILIKSELSLEELDSYYSAYRKTEWDYIVKAQDDGTIGVLYDKYSFKTDVSDGGYYIVYSWGNGISPFDMFDMRGH